MGGDGWRFCLAPMMARTDRHFRMLSRLIAPRLRLYSEMITADAIIHGDRERLLAFDERERPVCLQIAAATPEQAYRAGCLVGEFGYDEINLNAGCPSSRVGSGGFGAVMMRDPARIGDCLAALVQSQRAPVTVKCRLGVDEQEVGAALRKVTESAGRAGAIAIIVHARKAWLDGINPAQNRSVPPLDYAAVRRLKGEFPSMAVVLNGGLVRSDQLCREVTGLDGVMIGRAAYGSPWILADMERQLFGLMPGMLCCGDVLREYRHYALRAVADGASVHSLLRHLVGLFRAVGGARRLRGGLSQARTVGELRTVLGEAIAFVE